MRSTEQSVGIKVGSFCPGILERMLEDCKRRKREYALEED